MSAIRGFITRLLCTHDYVRAWTIHGDAYNAYNARSCWVCKHCGKCAGVPENGRPVSG